ncbi:phage shock protein A, PspA [Catenovulum agarivorans DS-2]|uniref:Phage shock protein A, PspA n=1 Tax=Catenovulum agarivorans DS-2 TaxID=1328313 RepID=W7R2K0_9ALTE|nr:phage shock protein PspA [Catenovulum agarivorans]EWH11855.1 phage shock protein A, PspA [Catenovulum agarivorans DS-2]
MGIFSRFADIVNSNINALLDKAEDPAKMVRLIIQEMEDTLVEVRSNSAKVLADKKDLVRRLQRLQQQQQDWQEKAELAISKDREDLARAALLEKKRISDQEAMMTSEVNLLDEQLDKLQSEIQQLQDKLTDAKARQKALIMKHETVSARVTVKRQLDADKVRNSLDRFDAYERKIGDIEAEADSYDIASKNLNAEFEDLVAKDGLDEELAKLKAKVKSDNTQDK